MQSGQFKVPKELMLLFRKQTEATQSGDIATAIELQKEINATLERLDAPVYEYPEEYFRIMHELMTLPSDAEQHRDELQKRMNEIFAELGIDVPTASEIPEECQRIQDQMVSTGGQRDWCENIRLTREFDRCMQKHGLQQFSMPDEYYNLQIEAMEAFDAMDMPKYHRTMARVAEIQEELGIFNLVNVIE